MLLAALARRLMHCPGMDVSSGVIDVDVDDATAPEEQPKEIEPPKEALSVDQLTDVNCSGRPPKRARKSAAAAVPVETPPAVLQEIEQRRALMAIWAADLRCVALPS